ncbi:hypothetical protein [Palleronia caenipelagi]|uniref:Uncharacterized protein n=1 Tax=Palleronia caenipelagi TaxID=2489174 RepID=A0A547PW39_9RHOB|nr:hypothetical protein [Palleronia caenipelagi]TRD18370.1 hypothetical protein FEV53_11990 [Palleronia caenipelagi]
MSAEAIRGSGGHKTALAGELRERALRYVEERPEFTSFDLVAELAVSAEWARKVIREWSSAGVIETVRQDGQTAVWRLREQALESSSLYARERARPEYVMWQEMRRARRFRPDELQLVVNTERLPIDLKQVRKYCSDLAEAGYLDVAVKGRAGGRLPTYVLRGRRGPFPPRVIRAPVLFDPNEETFQVMERRVQR